MTLFHDPSEYYGFLELLAHVKKRYPFTLYSYCLMPNHIHLLLGQNACSPSIIMRIILSFYSANFNRRHARMGHVFQGRYKSIPCTKNPYFLAVIRYIHLNPVAGGLVKDPADWEWSSHGEYLRRKPGITDVSQGLAMFDSDAERAATLYREFMETPPSMYDDLLLESAARKKSAPGMSGV